MEINQIRYFILAAQLQNFSRAAQILNVTQPTLSISISHLEDELGVRLFDRSGKTLTLNESGRNFLESAETLIQNLENAVASVKSQVSRPTVRLGLFHHSDRLLRVLAEFSEENPDVAFQADHLEIASRNIDTNEFDMLLYPRGPLFRKYRGEVVYFDPYMLAVHRSNPLAEKESAPLSDISGQKTVFIKYDNNLFDLPYHLCAGLGIDMADGLFTNSYEVQRLLVSSGRGIGFVPRGTAGAYAADPEIALVPIAGDAPGLDIMIGFKREKHLNDAGRRFAAFVRGRFGF